MRLYHLSIIIVALAAALVLLVPQAALAQGFSIVPCGSEGQQPCTFHDMIILIVRIINFLLAASFLVSVYYILMSSWGMMSALGNPEKIANAKDGLTRAVIGFSIVLLSFAFINLLIQGIFQINCNWWEDPLQLWSDQSCLAPNN